MNVLPDLDDLLSVTQTPHIKLHTDNVRNTDLPPSPFSSLLLLLSASPINPLPQHYTTPDEIREKETQDKLKKEIFKYYCPYHFIYSICRRHQCHFYQAVTEKVTPSFALPHPHNPTTLPRTIILKSRVTKQAQMMMMTISITTSSRQTHSAYM